MLLLVLGGLVLIATIGGVALVVRASNRDTTSERLEQFVGGGAPAGQGAQPNKAADMIESVDQAVSKSERGSKIARDLARADLKLRVVEFIGLKIVAGAVGALLGAVLGRADTMAMTGAAVLGFVVFLFIPDIYVNSRAKGRVKAFNNQLGDTISMMANALRGGYAFLQTMDLVAREAPKPTSDEFRRVVQEVGLGRTTEDALNNLQRRVPSEDLDLLVTAVNIQHEVGGNLAQILDTIGHTIRERVRIKGEIQTLTAQGRISGYVITALPILLAGYIQLVNPEYMAPMFTFGFPPDAWCCLPVTSLVMIAIGYWAIMKIVDIEV
jgi:tight adherence protein B